MRLKNIKGYNGRYLISDNGKVYSPKIQYRFIYGCKNIKK